LLSDTVETSFTRYLGDHGRRETAVVALAIGDRPTVLRVVARTQ
jgi:hypothetical protein